MQVKRCNSIANALELRLSSPNTLIWFFKTVQTVKNINIYQLPLLVVNKIFVITFFVHGCPQIIIEQWRDWVISWIPVWLFTSALSVVVGNAQITCTVVISQHFNGGDVVVTLELAFFSRHSNWHLHAILMIFSLIGHIGGIVQDCGISIAKALEIPQSSTKPFYDLCTSELNPHWFQ